jgi:2-methylisocitrate lyase-like PEP mutase family enzyme
VTTQAERARAFRELHHRGPILVLPNAWDAASARAFELEGARAVATTSSGVAHALGYPDGEYVPRDLLLTVVRRIVASVQVPVTVDLVAGYGETPAAVRDSVRLVVEAGAVGVNVEDRTEEPDVLVDKVRAVRELDVPVFVNARTDWYLRAKGTPEERFAETVRRARAYEAAGADGLFVPGLGDPAIIARLLAETRLPLNVMAAEDVPPVRDLERLGVRRVSIGGGAMRASVGLTRRIARALLVEGTYDAFLAGTPSHREVDGMFSRPPA